MSEINLKMPELKNMLKEVHCITSINFSQYAFSFLKRRTEVFMQANKIDSDSDFIYKINKSPGIAGMFLEAIFVPDSEFFRDAEMWNYLLEKLLVKYNENKELKIHLPYSTSGEELYSLLYVLNTIKKSQNIEILVSAVTDVHLNRIKKGEFNNYQIKSSVKNIELLNSAKDSDDIFDLNDKYYIVKHNFKGQINYDVCDFFKGRYINEFDIIISRNNLIYFNSELQEKSLKVLTRSLKKGGYLIIGACETLGDNHKKRYKQINKALSIYKKKSIG